ncbi:MAG TPA: N-acetylglucosamine-6-phosphate deacetylase [Pyrinomonadaceae bacterium]|nr:N-acetylglucosamine-6-phosphate deacetylase [Pyrinomonadaceae bacterium]
MSRSLFLHAAVIGSESLSKDAAIVVDDGLIAAIQTGTGAASGNEAFDCAGLTLMPGFIDVHIHGAMGIDVNVADVDGLLEIGKFLARNGVTAWLPTLVPDSDENYARVVGAIDLLMEIQDEEPVARAVGVHYEGVFANENMCGALRPQYFKKFPADQLSQLPRLERGVHMTTFAPEVEGGIGLAKELKRQGWIAAIGHTRADVETLDKAFEAGAKHLTHFYNAMTGLHHRDVGVVGWALTNPKVTFDIIADGIHVHPAMLGFACRSKGIDNVTLISDSIAAAGMGDGEFEIWGEKIMVENGRTQNERGAIAGSVITMLESVRRMRSLGFSDSEVSLMASRNPAMLVGLEGELGSLAVGQRADLVAIDNDGNVKLTFVGGRLAYDGR